MKDKFKEELSKIDLRLAGLLGEINEMLPSDEKIKFYYREIEKSKVSISVLRAAEKVLNYCKKELGLKALWIQWCKLTDKTDLYAQEHDELFYGKAVSNELLVRWDVPLREIKFTIAHEAHHVWFREKHGDSYPYPEEKETWEDGADNFAQEAMRRLKEQEAFENDEGLQLVYANIYRH